MIPFQSSTGQVKHYRKRLEKQDFFKKKCVSVNYESSKSYAQNGRYFLFLSDVDSSEIFINPKEQVSFNSLVTMELFFTSIPNRSRKEEFVI